MILCSHSYLLLQFPRFGNRLILLNTRLRGYVDSTSNSEVYPTFSEIFRRFVEIFDFSTVFSTKICLKLRCIALSLCRVAISQVHRRKHQSYKQETTNLPQINIGILKVFVRKNECEFREFFPQACQGSFSIKLS